MCCAGAFVATSPLLRGSTSTPLLSTRRIRRNLAPSRTPVRCAVLETTTLISSGVLDSVQHALFGPLFAPLDACIPADARLISWLNFRVAVLFFVLTPLAIFGGALARGPNTPAGDALTRVMSGYWQASALLLVAVFQHAAGLSFAFADGLLVQTVVVASLNWWTDLLAEINESDGALEAAFRIWRPVASVSAGLGVLVQIPFQSCNFSSTCACRSWTEPPVRLFELLGGVDQSILATLGNTGMSIYLAYLVYYLVVVVPKIGRQGRAPRDFFTAPSVLMWLGVIGPWGRKEKTNR